ncbi:hypothetical protein DERP_007198 [Dermatophagoides pteronyssinus]|uniref:Uncharacterized protein n=1 Tax=Dermatophagoides pteronyssinus TaxID=6956 RepID=A0ABQ8JV23_DERPT|nr:hypothetical protein DERP_007198 [Dermatophagoides pteronyssinus]
MKYKASASNTIGMFRSLTCAITVPIPGPITSTCNFGKIALKSSRKFAPVFMALIAEKYGAPVYSREPPINPIRPA